MNDRRPEEWLVGGGRMGELVRSFDWSRTPLGPRSAWPQSLRTTVSLCLASNFPISLAWGPAHVQIYNDGYWPICGAKHPHSMGQNFAECWASAWPAIGEAFECALGGETRFLEDQRMFLDRNGYLEETFFTFSFSPIRDESGGVGGLFHPVTETTGKMIGARRTRALRDLSARAGRAQSTADALATAAETLAEFAFDLPFALFYLLSPGSKEAVLAARAGLDAGHVLCPQTVDTGAPPERGWPLSTVLRTGALPIEELERRFGAFTCDPYPEPPKCALAFPIGGVGGEGPVAILIAGVSSRLPLSETYRGFFDLVAAGVASAVGTARAYEEERKRAEALAEIDRAKTTFFSNVSHEFRTPLTLLLGPLEDELAERLQPLPPARRARLDTAFRNALRLLKLVNALLDFSRIEAGRVRARFQATDLAFLTADLASVFRSAVEKAGLTFAIDCPPLGEPLFVDREMWEKIVLNLLSNALKHTFEGGIRVTLRDSGDTVKMTVADTGIGISAAELPHLFERFHRVEGAKSRTHEGTGIGLALVQELVRMHDGSVRVESDQGKGTTFTVTLKRGRAHLPQDHVDLSPGASALSSPLSSPSAAAAFLEETMQWLPATAPSPVELAVTAASARSSQALKGTARRPERTTRPRVLWADDNADMRDYVRRILAERYEVVAVADGAAALEAARQDPPDLVLTDVMMPNLDGFGLLRELRADPRTETIPIILLSARAGGEASIEGLDAGADDYLVKPFSARELVARVATHIELARLRRRWAQQLEKANKELEAFSYSISHDLRAPLRAINGFARMLAEDQADTLDAKGLRYLDIIQKNTVKMGALIDALLLFSRLGRQAVVNETVDMTTLVRAVAEEAAESEPARVIEFEISPLPRAFCDAALIRQVWVNLIGNAVKYTRGRSPARVQVEGRVEGKDAIYTVRDNGAGFDMQYVGRLFGVFERLHTSADFEGNGVGLALVQRIVQGHEGRVWAEGRVDVGATIGFTLRATDEP